MLRGGSRQLGRTFRTIVGRLACVQRGESTAYQLSSGSSQTYPTSAEIAALDPREFVATIGPHASACEKNAASTRVHGFLHPFHATSYAFDICVSRALDGSLKPKLSGGSPVCPSSLVGAYCMDGYMNMPNSVLIHGCGQVLPESVQRKKYFIQARTVASTTGKPFQQADGKTPLDSSRNKNKINEDDQKKTSKEDGQTEEKSLGARVRNLLSDLENVPVPALGLGLAGAIPFVALTPGIASILPLPEFLYDVHIEAQAAYGAVILTFLGGPHWGLAMTDNGESSKSAFSRVSIRSLRYVWSVTPSLVAWTALVLPSVPKFVVLITSFGLVCGVDAFFARMGLLPPWYMPLRILLTSIAMLSMTSSLIVTAAINATAAVTQ